MGFCDALNVGTLHGHSCRLGDWEAEERLSLEKSHCDQFKHEKEWSYAICAIDSQGVM